MAASRVHASGASAPARSQVRTGLTGHRRVGSTAPASSGPGRPPRRPAPPAPPRPAGLAAAAQSDHPIISPCLAATALICFIFAWDEFFLAVNLTTVNGATVPAYPVGFVQPEGPFLAHLPAAVTILSAAATIACLPVLLAGWGAQDKPVSGLSMGAVK